MNFETTINKIMDKEPLIVNLDEDLASVAQKMTEKNKEAVIIMDGNDVKGILKFSDICYAIKTLIFNRLLMDKIPSDIKVMQINELMRNPKLKDVFNKCGFTTTCPPISLREDNTVADAISVMASSGLDRLLVNTDSGEIGLVEDHDLINALKEKTFLRDIYIVPEFTEERLTSCGSICSICPSFKGEKEPICHGCNEIEAKPPWLKGDQCEIYACLNSKGLRHHGECEEFPCKKFMTLNTPCRLNNKMDLLTRIGLLTYLKGHKKNEVIPIIDEIAAIQTNV